MDQAITVAPGVRNSLRVWDPSLRLELIDRLAKMAESPSEFVTRSGRPDLPGSYAFTHLSDAIAGLRISAYFDGLDDDPPHLMLVAIEETMDR